MNTYQIDKVGEPFRGTDLPQLLEILHDVEPTSAWGVGIKYAFENKCDIVELLAQLASQAVDDPLTMMKIVGFEGTILLLKYHKR